ncbi:ATP-binding protein [Nocardioides mangrovicus]|uniref:ATP-binding protein n=1 Tax=Nocardioides mangrovicus TaxID=2478913 RepID=UPI001314930B|nr:ATP-binding protein [Nocardioides mangrovicus]
MSLSRQHALTLPATPRAVKVAREWVARVLREIGRGDLADSAELGVSELVTNAIMHSSPPVAVRVRGTQAHPRIEVADRSLVPPRPIDASIDLDAPDEDLLTFGRGLALVALHSSRWGSDIDAFGMGKAVWFEPVAEPREDPEVNEGDLFDLEQLVAEHTGSESDEMMTVRLLATPVTSLSDVRRKFNELRRELRLLALTNAEHYPLAVEFSEVALRAEIELRRYRGFEVLADAEHDGVDRLDLVVDVPRTMARTVGRLVELLAEVYAFFDEAELLVTPPTPRQQQVQAWYLGEFVRQGDGDDPAPWTGGYRDHRGGAQTA